MLSPSPSLNRQRLGPLDPQPRSPVGAALTHSSLPVTVSDQMLCPTSSARSKSMNNTEMICDRVITQWQKTLGMTQRDGEEQQKGAL